MTQEKGSNKTITDLEHLATLPKKLEGQTVPKKKEIKIGEAFTKEIKKEEK